MQDCHSQGVHLDGGTIQALGPRYTLVKALGVGTFGKVILCSDAHNNNELVAIKLIERGGRKADYKYVESEVRNHFALSHPHVIEFKEVLLTPKYLGIVMEYVSGGCMFDKACEVMIANRRDGVPGCFPEQEARFYFQQLIFGLDYCHRMGVVNRDIKLENLLVEPVEECDWYNIKICDFGYSKHFHTEVPSTKMIGSVYCAAPEMLLNNIEAYDGRLADIWGAGVVLYYLLFGCCPWARQTHGTDTQKINALLANLRTANLYIPEGVSISPGCVDLLRRLLQAEPSQRISMAHILTHPWFQEDLPEGALDFNMEYLSVTPTTIQTAEEIGRILNEARTPGAPDQSSSMMMME